MDAACSGIYLFLPHGRQAGWGPRGHGRDAHLSGHLAHAAHAAGCHIGSHGDVVEVHAIAVVHVVVILLGELWRCLLLWEHAAERWRAQRVNKCSRSIKADTRGLILVSSTCCLPCCLVASHSCQENPEKKRFLGLAASSETVCGPCVEKGEGSVVCPWLQSLRLPVGSYLP